MFGFVQNQTGAFIIRAYWQTYFRIRAHEAFKTRAPYRAQDSLYTSTSVEALLVSLNQVFCPKSVK